MNQKRERPQNHDMKEPSLKRKCLRDDMFSKVYEYVTKEMSGNDVSHDMFHIDRVRAMALTLAKDENVTGDDLVVTELAALLHDVKDHKYDDGSGETAEEAVQNCLAPFVANDTLSNNQVKEVIDIVTGIGYSKSLSEGKKERSKPFQIVQDADRLDAIGAVGIARCMCYTARVNRPIFDPKLQAHENMTEEEYKKNKGTAVNHFYEKLFKLKGLMNTPKGKVLAEQRHALMVLYINQIKQEYEGTM
mmetsp:Transcript_10803/g.15821  ORF Transcript_10803/g.15821 Transcript_10803/m.15821 type:complete len:247 (+) Transcript_10803:47-787(+)